MSAPAPSEHAITFTPDVLGEAVLGGLFLTRYPELDRVCRRESLITFLAVSLPFLIFASVFTSIFIAEGGTVPFAVIAGIAIGVPVLMYLWRPGPWRLMRTYLHAMGTEGAYNRPITIEPRPQGVHLQWDGATATYPWHHCGGIVLGTDHVAILWANTPSGQCIPKSAWPSADACAAWVARVERFIRDAGADEATIVTKTLTQTSIHCGVCGHDLKGLRDPRCPECGLAITPARLSMWHYLDMPLWPAVWRVMKASWRKNEI